MAIKSLPNNRHDVEISQYLTSIQSPDNHCAPIFDNFPDPLDPTQRTLIILPNLRPFDDPELVKLGEVLDFMSQMLEVCYGPLSRCRYLPMQGLAFMHRNRVAHRCESFSSIFLTRLIPPFRDIAPQNIMMDASSLFPQGYHPVRRDHTPDVMEEVKPLSRMDHPVRYYYIDFGLSVRFPEGASPLVIGNVGRDAEVPELSSTALYDGYKADIYALGNLFSKEFEQVCLQFSCFVALIVSCFDRSTTRSSSCVL